MKANFQTRKGILVLLAISVIGVSLSHGQNRPLERALEQMRDVILGGGPGATEAVVEDQREEDPAEAGSEDDTPLGVDFRAIHLLSHQERATMASSIGSGDVQVDPDLPAPEGIESALRPYLGTPMSMASLSALGRDIVEAWRESDYPLVDVYYPEQNISEGKIQVVVREAVLGEKSVEGARVSRESYLLSHLRVDPGDRINRRVVEEDLDWLNENPIRQVNMIYQRGEEDGTSDIVLAVTEEKALTAYSGFANTGVNFTGQEEWSFGFNLHNPLQREHMVGYHYATDLEWENLQAHSLFYQAFLPWRHTLRIIGAHVESDSENPIPINTSGVSEQLSVEYRIPLPRPEFHRQWKHALTFGFDYKSTDTDLLFGGLTFFGTDVEVGQFRGRYEATVPDSLGVTRFSVGVVGSPGDMFRDNDDASFGLARVGSTADYWYGVAELERLFRLPGDFTLRFDLSAQVSNDRLASTEQMLGGGYRSVRGFDESVIRGDSGVLTTVELISPEFSLLNRIQDPRESPKGKGVVTDATSRDVWNAFVFYDTAAMDISDPVAGEISQSLQSVGVGMTCRFSDRGFARASYGWAIEDHGLLPTDNDDGKFHFGVTLTY